MVRSEAIEVLSRRLSINPGRLAALAQRVADAGALPKARGRDIPALGPLDLAKLLICAIADRGLGSAPRSVAEYSALTASNGAILIDLVEGWVRGAVPLSGVRHLIVQTEPEPAATVISHGGEHLNFGPDRSRDAAARTVIVPGNTLAAIAAEFRGASPHQADEAVAVAKLAAALN
jgi:hypothetical protein